METMTKSRQNPDTSIQAWQLKQPTLPKDHDRILSILGVHFCRIDGMNYEQIALCTSMEPVAVARRLSELERRGLIEKSGVKTITSKKRNSNNYRLKTF